EVVVETRVLEDLAQRVLALARHHELDREQRQAVLLHRPFQVVDRDSRLAQLAEEIDSRLALFAGKALEEALPLVLLDLIRRRRRHRDGLLLRLGPGRRPSAATTTPPAAPRTPARAPARPVGAGRVG